MATLKDRIVELVTSEGGLTDLELTDRLQGSGKGQQAVNQAARALADLGKITRLKRQDGKIANYPIGAAVQSPLPTNDCDVIELSEDDVKEKLRAWLEAAGWGVTVRLGREHGADIEAERGEQQWIIEVKGCGSIDPMRVNYFLAILGEILQRMKNPDARYSIALPDKKQFRSLWSRLPQLAKSRTQITALFVASTGDISEAQ